MMSSISISSNDDFIGHDVHCSIAQTNNLLYSRSYDQTRPFREQIMHGRFAFSIENHFVYAVLTGFDDNAEINAVRYYTALLQMVISERIQNRRSNLNSHEQDEFYTRLLKDAFSTVEDQFRQHKSDKLSEKVVFDIELHGNRPEDYPKINDRLKELSHELSAGLSAVVALIQGGRVFVANIGDTRAILCRKVVTDSGLGSIRAVQLSTTHNLDNQSELQRLSQLGLNTDLIRQKNSIGTMGLTRCLGNLWLKSFYKDFVDLTDAAQDPILAEPEIASMALDHNCLFLVLASASLIETLREAINKSEVNDDLVKMIYDEFQNEGDRESISQSVINNISELHQNCFAASSNYSRPTCRQIDDLTLLIRDLTVGANEAGPSDALLNVNRQLAQMNISIDTSLSEHSDQDSVYTPNDTERTITDRPNGFSRSQNNLVEDGGPQNDDEDEIDAYVDFTELLEAYHEVPVESK